MSELHAQHGLELYIMEVFCDHEHDTKWHKNIWILHPWVFIFGTIYFDPKKLESFELCTCRRSISLSLIDAINI